VLPDPLAEVEVNPSEYAAEDPEDAPVFVVVTSKVFVVTFEIVPLKLSALAFLTITISPLECPWFALVIVRVVVTLVQESPALTVEEDVIQI